MQPSLCDAPDCVTDGCLVMPRHIKSELVAAQAHDCGAPRYRERKHKPVGHEVHGHQCENQCEADGAEAACPHTICGHACNYILPCACTLGLCLQHAIHYAHHAHASWHVQWLAGDAVTCSRVSCTSNIFPLMLSLHLRRRVTRTVHRTRVMSALCMACACSVIMCARSMARPVAVAVCVSSACK